jgi:integrase
LRWADIDPESGTLRVRRALQRQRAQHGCDNDCGRARATDCPHRRGGGVVFVPPKSRAGNRTVVLPARLAEALQSHRRVQAAERLAAGSEWTDLDLVFAQPNGRPIDPRNDWGQWKALLRTAGVRDARLHDARHTAATLALLQGISPRVVMQILGHSQIGLTLGTYSHMVPELAADAAARMDTALWGPPVSPQPENGDRNGTAVRRRPEPKNARGQRSQGKSRWGGWDSNPRPRDYEILRTLPLCDPLTT